MFILERRRNLNKNNENVCSFNKCVYKKARLDVAHRCGFDVEWTIEDS